MRTAVPVALALLLGACSSLTPIPIQSTDMCFRCGRPIADVKLGAEMIDSGGHVFKFRTPGCLAQFVQVQKPAGVRGLFVTDFSTGKLVRAESALYVRVEVDPQTRELDYRAFRSVNAAVAAGKENKSSAIDWSAVLVQARSASMSN
ncbi:MAG: hypothetical protein HYX76_12175 [Acidobacteria bacterium]|nr:hypothetical protein [Acidobacteriota bacterium]